MTAAPTPEPDDLAPRIRARKRGEIERNDVGNAARLVLDHGHDLRYVPGPGWHAWDGRRWRRDDDGELVRRAKATVQTMREDAAHLATEDARDALWKWANRSADRARLTNMVALAESDLRVIARADDLDSDSYLFNVENGTVDLRTGELRPHDRTDLITKLAPVEHDAADRCPTFDAFLATITGGVPDLARYLQRAVGYTLTADTSEQCLFLAVGAGSNGKTTLLETLHALAGDYATRTSTATLMAKGAAPGGPRPDLARLHGARYVPAVEVEDGARFAEVLVKEITGGDTIVARHLYRDEFAFKPRFKLWLAANNLPGVRGTDHAIWRRMRVLPFQVRIEQPDKQMAERLRAELPGILNWATQGARDWQRDGLGPPGAVREATHAYRASQDTLGAFLEDRAQLAPGSATPAADLYAAYRGHCEDQGVEPLPGPRFKTAMAERGLTQRRVAEGRLWQGVELT